MQYVTRAIDYIQVSSFTDKIAPSIRWGKEFYLSLVNILLVFMLICIVISNTRICLFLFSIGSTTSYGELDARRIVAPTPTAGIHSPIMISMTYATNIGRVSLWTNNHFLQWTAWLVTSYTKKKKESSVRGVPVSTILKI